MRLKALKYSPLFDAFGTAILLFLLLGRLNVATGLIMSFCGMAMSILTGHKKTTLTGLDAAVLMFAASCIFSAAFALYESSAIVQVGLCLLAVNCYFLSRVSSVDSGAVPVAMSIAAIVYSGRGFARFTDSYRRWQGMHFSHLSDFRAYVTLAAPGVSPGNPNALYLVFAACCAAGLIRCYPRSWRAYSLVLPLPLLALSGVLTFSRGMYLSAILGAIVFMFTARVSLSCIAAGAMGVLGALVVGACIDHTLFAAVVATTKFLGSTSQALSSESRFRYLSDAMTLLRSRPLTGFGPGNYNMGVQDLSLYSGPDIVTQPFNSFMLIGAEQGVIGLAAIMSVWVSAFAALIAYLNDNPTQRKRLALLTALSASVCTYSCFQSIVLSNISISVGLFVLLGQIASLEQRCD